MKIQLYLLLLILSFVNIIQAQDYERYKTVPDTSIISKHLGYEKNISITVPIEWQAETSREFPLIVLFDRQNPRSLNYIINTIDYLTSTEQMPSAIVVSIESGRKYRKSETLHKATSEKGLAAENEKFLFDELIPFIEHQYNASSFRLFIGHSRYGYFTTSLLNTRIDELSGVISLSPFFIQNNVDLTDSIKTISQKEFSSKKYYRFGIGNDYPSQFLKMDSTINTTNNPNFDFKGFLFKEADHYVTPGLTIGISLYEIFEKWASIQSKYSSNKENSSEVLPSLQEEINSNYGSSLEFSLGTLNGKGWQYYNENKFEKAIKAWEIMMQYYPSLSEGYMYIINAKTQLNQDTAEMTKLFHESLNNSQLYTEEEKLELKEEFEKLSH